MFSNITGNRTMQEMLALANEMAQRIAYDTRDWTKLRTTATYTGDGIDDQPFDLPANYKRMLLTSNVWRSTSTQTPMTFVPDTDEWLQPPRRRLERQAWGEWTMCGGKMHHLRRRWPVGETAYFAYLDKNCVDARQRRRRRRLHERRRHVRARRAGAEARHDLAVEGAERRRPTPRTWAPTATPLALAHGPRQPGADHRRPQGRCRPAVRACLPVAGAAMSQHQLSAACQCHQQVAQSWRPSRSRRRPAGSS